MANNPLVDELKRLKSLEEFGQTPEGLKRAEVELNQILPNLRAIAANANEPLDPANMGQIEGMLRSGDEAGLRARLGEVPAARLQGLYARAVAEDVNAQKDRSVGRAAADLGITAVDMLGESVVGAAVLGANSGPIPGFMIPDYVKSGEILQDYRKYYNDPSSPLGYSQELANRDNRRQLQLEAQQKEHAAQFDAQTAGPDASSGIVAGVKQFSKDALSAGSTLVQDPALLAQGVASAVVTMGEGAAVNAGLRVLAKTGIKAAVQGLEKKAISSELEQLATARTVEELAAAKLSPTEVFRLRAAEGFAKHLDALTGAGSTGLTEGLGGYTQTMNDVLSRSPADLMQTSPVYKKYVQEEYNKDPAAGSDQAYLRARTRLAHEAALEAGTKSGVASMLSGAAFPEGQSLTIKSPAKSLFQAYLKDIGKESAQEVIEGATGASASTDALRKYVDPTIPIETGLAQQMAEGGILAMASTGAVKGPQLLQASGKLASETATHFADKRIAKIEAAGLATADKLTEEASQLQKNPEIASKIQRAAVDVAANVPVEQKQEFESTLKALVNSSQVVGDLPEAVNNLPTEMKAALDASVNRVDMINKAAVLYNAEKDSTKREKLGLALEALLEPVRKFEKLPPVLSVFNDHADGKAAISEYQGLLTKVQALPQVVKAQVSLERELAKREFKDFDPSTPDGIAEAQRIATLATTDPALHGVEVSPIILAHASAVDPKYLTESQRNALKGTVALIDAQEAADRYSRPENAAQLKEMLAQHVAGNRTKESVGRQVILDTELNDLNKMSLKAFVGTITKAITNGDTERAQFYMDRLSNFAESQNNKVEAFNEAFSTGNTVPYMQAVPAKGNGVFELSSTNPDLKTGKQKYAGVFVNSNKSVEVARRVDLENQLLATGYNSLLKAFPQLQGVARKATALDSGLGHGSVSEALQAAKAKLEVKKPQEPKPTSAPAKAAVAEKTPSPPPAAPQKKASEAIQPPTTAAAVEPPPLPKRQSKPKVVEAKSQPESKPVVKEQIKETPSSPPAVVEQKPAAAPTPAAPEAKPVEAPPVRRTLVDRFQNLAKAAVHGAKEASNTFQRAFKLKKEATRFTDGGGDKAVEQIYTALDSRQSLEQFLGELPSGYDSGSTKAYQELLQSRTRRGLGGLTKKVRENLQTALWDKKKNQTIIDKFREYPELMVTSRGKALGLVEESNGKIEYNGELLQLALLAGLQWQIAASQRKGIIKEDQIWKSLGINSQEYPGLETSLSDRFYERMADGVPLYQAKQQLAEMIVRFWGVRSDTSMPMGYTEGIPEAMAAEILRAMADPEVGLVTVDAIQLADEMANLKDSRGRSIYLPQSSLDKLPADQRGSFKPTINKTILRYKAQDLSRGDSGTSPLYGMPSLLEQMVLKDWTPATFFSGEEAVPPVAEGHMNNPQVTNTAPVKTALKNQQKAVFYENIPLSIMLQYTDERKMLYALGAEYIEPKREDQYNINDLEARQAKASGFLNAFAASRRNHQESLQRNNDPNATTEKGKIFEYAVGDNNRMMMRETYNPQSNKWMREVWMTTWSELDLQTTSHRDYFMLALAQGLQQKIHRESFKDNVRWAEEEVISDSGKFAPAIKVISNYLQADTETPGEFPVQAYLNALPEGTEALPIVLMALTEAARFRLAPTNKPFKTPLYLEADGISNGPFNSFGLVTIGSFDENWVSNVQRGGLGFDLNSEGKPLTYDELYKRSDKVDLYGKAALTAEQGVKGVLEALASQRRSRDSSLARNADAAHSALSALYAAMSLVFPKDVRWLHDENTLKLGRGIAKGPMTQIDYGSGVTSASSKLVGELISVFYTKLTDVVQNPKLAETPEYRVLFEAIATTLSQGSVGINKDGEFYTRKSTAPSSKREILHRLENPRSFKFSVDEIQVLEDTLKVGLGNPLFSGIETTMGYGFTKAKELIVRSTGLIGSVAGIIYLRAIESAAQSKIDKYVTDGMARPAAQRRFASEFLSHDELDKVWEDVKGAMPLVQVDNQKFLFSKDSLKEFWDTTGSGMKSRFAYSRALDDSMETEPVIPSIGNPGVKGLPFFVIGLGDARMVREFFQDPTVTRAFQVYDGINLPVDKIPEYGSKINEAAGKAFKANVFKGLYTTMESFRTHPALKSIQREMRNSLEFSSLVRNVVFDQFNDPEGKYRDANQNIDLADYIDEVRQQLLWSAQSMEARLAALNQVQHSFDQMAGTYQPYLHSGESLAGKSNQEIAQILQEKYQKALASIQAGIALDTVSESNAKLDKTPVSQPLPAKVLQVAQQADRGSGAIVTTGKRLKDLPAQLSEKLSRAEKGVLNTILKSKLLDGVRIVSGTSEEIEKYQELQKTSSLARVRQANPGAVVNGFFSPDEKTIYLVDPTVESTVHELVHAATYQLVEAYYDGKLTSDLEVGAIKRLEGLMNLFLQDSNTDGLDPTSSAYIAIKQAQAAINQYRPMFNQSSAQKAAALNEFMAWSLSNKALQEDLPSWTVVDRLVKLARSAWNEIKKLIFGERAPDGLGHGTDMLSQIRFNTAILAQSTYTPEERVNDLVLAHATLRGMNEEDVLTPTQLEATLEAFGSQVARHMGQAYTPEWRSTLAQNPAFGKIYERANELANQAADIFDLKAPLALETFRMVVMSLATDAHFNPHALTKASEIFDQWIASSNVNTFISNPEADTDSYNEQARQSKNKFEFLTGQITGFSDRTNRSTMLPVFVALSMISPELRQDLSKKSIAEKSKPKVDGLNSGIRAFATEALTRVGNMLSGQSQPADMRAAMDQLTQYLTQEMLHGQTSMENALETARGISNGLNNKLVHGMQWLSDHALSVGDQLTDNGGKLNTVIGRTLQAMAILTSEKNSAIVSEPIQAALDKMPNLPHMLREFLGRDGLLGRQQSEAELYDMYKKVRATVERTRQDFRDKIPLAIQSKISKLGIPAFEAAQDILYRMMGRSDLASLVPGRGIAAALTLAGDHDAREAEILSLERKLADAQPQYIHEYEKKINQLVNYMHGGPVGSGLLPNAWAIANLLTVEKDPQKFLMPTNEMVDTIDQLVTLKYLEQIPESEQDTFRKLVRDEKDGISFMMSYLKGNREGELEKALVGKATFNHQKGFLPYDSTRGHLVVVPVGQHTEMVLQGYQLLGEYTGSSIDNQDVKLAYYYSPEGGTRTQFNQGLIQNVQGTAFGVHTHTGFSGRVNAGFITDPVEVKRLASQLGKEEKASKPGSKFGRENLAPVFGADGSIIAFERTLNPEMLKHLHQDQHLSKMIGHWRGRQVEESQATDMNLEVVDHLYNLWEQDQNIPGGRERYENLYDSKDPVIQDALSIMPFTVRNAIESKFGRKTFMVRRGMVNQVAGYRLASIGDLWTGNTRISAEVQDTVRKTFIAILGPQAYRKAVWFEQNWQAVTKSMRTNIVVRSFQVAKANMISGFYQLMVRNVPLKDMLTGAVKKVAEVETYMQVSTEIINLEAELHAAQNINQLGAIRSRIQERQDRLRRLSIWPLIEAGEFSAIADVGQTAQEFGDSNGTIIDKLEAMVDKLPPGLRDAARLGYISRDTALFQGLQKWVQYSDFVMKSIYYDHLMSRGEQYLEESHGYEQVLDKTIKKYLNEDLQKIAETRNKNDPKSLQLLAALGLLPAEQVKFILAQARKSIALGKVTEEYNNYDLPAGRSRQYLESMGLMWFLTYKIRATKVGLAMLRENPLNTLLFSNLPHPMAGGIPFTDNLFYRLFHGSVGRAFGPGLLVEPISWNSWYNLFGN